MTAQSYPPALRKESGCKVKWLYYTDRSDAEVASRVAIREARQLEDLGYHWGYQCPGHIAQATDGTYAVCIPPFSPRYEARD